MGDRHVRLADLLRHGSALCLLAFGWKYLSDWYLYLNRVDYWKFAALFLAAILLAAGPFLRNSLFRLSRSRLLVILFLALICLPWGEWLRLNFLHSREDWSRQVYLQAIFVYACLLIFHLFPPIPNTIHRWTWKTCDLLSSKKYFLYLPPLIFFCLSSGVALFHLHGIPIVEDSASYLFQAKIFSHFRLYAPAPPVTDFFSVRGDMLAIQQGRWFGIYLPGFAALLSLAMFLRSEWLLCPLLGALTIAIWMAYLHRWHNARLACLFGWLILFSPFFLLMSSTIMVHTPELFFASVLIYFCRREAEGSSKTGTACLFAALLMAILVRGFSLLLFLAPLLGYCLVQDFQRRDWKTSVAVLSGIAVGVILVGLYQRSTTGNFWTPGYLIEFPEYRYGFGKSLSGEIHTPARGVENISNYLLGLNHWVTGWYSGSFVFVILFLASKKRMERWDLLLLLSALSLLIFLYFFVAQDLIVGPRFVFVCTPVVFVFLVRATGMDQKMASRLNVITTALVVASFLGSFPVRLPNFLRFYTPSTVLQTEIQQLGRRKTLIFLSRGMIFVNWNDPFLRDPLILCRDLKNHNTLAMAAFPDHHPAYFRLDLGFRGKQLNAHYGIFDTPSGKEPGQLSLYQLALTLEAAKEDPDRDFFDLCYKGFLAQQDVVSQQNYLHKAATLPATEKPYQREFRRGIVHAGLLLLLPQAAFEARGDRWFQDFDFAAFRSELQQATTAFQASGEVGKAIAQQLKRVHRRIDRNGDGNLTNNEIVDFLRQKVQLLKNF